MQWAVPFLEAAESIISLKRIFIKGYVLRRGVSADVDGYIRPYTDGSKLITIRLCEVYADKKTGAHKLQYLENLLVVLAHELAHLKHWEHTPEHLILESRLLVKFGVVAKKLGIKDMSRRLGRKKAAH